jgi:peptidoglycan/LPS O-acetylase OafA/YrhL
MATGFLDKFRRVTSSTGYLPEIDGLRFLAIFWVAIPMHALHYLDEKFYGHQLVRPGYWKDFVMEGTHGMYLFFMISGFILGLPFAKAHLLEGGRGISLKRYYLRRLTRLEPPYIIALILFFLAHVFVVGRYPLEQLVPSFLASFFYSHQLVYHQHPLILPVAWSLEIEVQFYILAPLFCLLFKLKNAWVRRGVLGALIMMGPWYHLYVSESINLARFAHYFFAGLLLADLYVTRQAPASSSKGGYWIGVASLVALFVFLSLYTLPGLMVKLGVLFVLFHQVLFNQRFKQLFTLKGITIIGGMCYSIYLLHFGIISAFGAWMLSRGVPLSNVNHAPLYLVLLTVLILLISGAYFYFIEKPFMKFNVRRWYRKAEKVPAE